MLETRDLTIRFGGHVAVNAVSCVFAPGTLTAIVGPNGAGKTTYFNLISGQLRASSGSVSLGGRDISGLGVAARTHAGLGRAFQLTNLFPNLSVLENVRLAVQATRPGRHRHGLNLWSVWSDHEDLTRRAHGILADVAMKDKQKNIREITNDKIGSAYTFTAIEAETKLIVAWHLGTRTEEHTFTFLRKVRDAVDPETVFQLSTDAFPGYNQTVPAILGRQAHYGQVIKTSGRRSKRNPLQPCGLHRMQEN